MEKNAQVEIAKLIGQPIDPNLRVPLALAEIADVESAEPGDLVRTLSGDDANSDDVYTVDGDGAITVHKVSPVAPATLTFSHLNTKLEYVLVKDIMDGADQSPLARKKAGLTRALDKIEVKNIMGAILAVASQEVAQATGEDLYDVIVKQMHKIEDYGDNFILLCGSTVKEKIDTYDKDNVSTFNYRIGLKEFLAGAGIKVVKMVGKVKLDGGTYDPILAADKMIMVARDSSLAKGKPIVFVRRKISPEIAAGMGVEVDGAERALVVSPVPTNIAGVNTLGYGVYAYESVIQAILNYRALAWSVIA